MDIFLELKNHIQTGLSDEQQNLKMLWGFSCISEILEYSKVHRISISGMVDAGIIGASLHTITAMILNQYKLKRIPDNVKTAVNYNFYKSFTFGFFDEYVHDCEFDEIPYDIWDLCKRNSSYIKVKELISELDGQSKQLSFKNVGEVGGTECLIANVSIATKFLNKIITDAGGISASKSIREQFGYVGCNDGIKRVCDNHAKRLALGLPTPPLSFELVEC